MANTLNLGTNGNWATKKESLLAYNSENNNFKPLPFSFTRDSGATRVNKEGLIEVVSNNEPRIDFKDSSEGALLLEPQRSNLIPYSEDFSQSSWVKTGLTVNTNQILSPDGSLNADEVNITTANAHYLFDTISVSASTNYIFTFYVKKGTATDVSYSILNATNFTNIVNTTSYFNEISDTEWTRISVEFTTPSGCTSIRTYPLRDGSEIGTIYIWGAQLEQGSYATSYIPTSGSVVTRVADSSSQTVPDGVIGQTEGTVYVEANVNDIDLGNNRISLSDGGTSNWLFFSVQEFTGSGAKSRVYIGNGANIVTVYVDSVGSGFHKYALSYKVGEAKFYIDGVLKATLNPISIPNCSVLNLTGSSPTNTNTDNTVSFNEVKLYNEALTDQELIALTS